VVRGGVRTQPPHYPTTPLLFRRGVVEWWCGGDRTQLPHYPMTPLLSRPSFDTALRATAGASSSIREWLSLPIAGRGLRANGQADQASRPVASHE